MSQLRRALVDWWVATGFPQMFNGREWLNAFAAVGRELGIHRR